MDAVEQQLQDVRTLYGEDKARGWVLRLFMSMVLVGFLLPTFAFSTAWAEVVPDVVGSSQTTAESEITSAGLTVGAITTTRHATVPSGSVINQTPAAGSAVALMVSMGPVVPNVVGITQAAAQGAFTTAGLKVGTVTSTNSQTVPIGRVISQNSASGTKVAAGSAVNLVVSLGAAVPNVVSLPQAATQTVITGASLTVGTVTTANDCGDWCRHQSNSHSGEQCGGGQCGRCGGIARGQIPNLVGFK